jgi:hypothetical protein
MEENEQQVINHLKVRTGMLVGKADKGKPTLYGTDWCGYTTKQKQAFDKAQVLYDYVNCETSPDKCAGISSYPTVKNYPVAGKGWVGFKPITKWPAWFKTG